MHMSYSIVDLYRLIISKPAQNRCIVVMLYYIFMQQIMFLVICPRNIQKPLRFFAKIGEVC